MGVNNAHLQNKAGNVATTIIKIHVQSSNPDYVAESSSRVSNLEIESISAAVAFLWSAVP